MTAILSGSMVAALLAGATIALIAAFLVRPTSRVIRIPSLLVIRACLPQALVERGANRWPRRILGLLLALGAGWLLVGTAADPTWFATEAPPGIVFIVDASPSMQASSGERSSDKRITRFDDALKATREAILQTGGERLLVALGGSRLVPLGAWQSGPDGAIAMLHSATPGNEALDIATVVEDAGSLLGPTGGRIVLVSDMAFEWPPTLAKTVHVEGIRVGEAAQNVTLATLAARMNAGRRTLATALVTVASYGSDADGLVILESSREDQERWVLASALPFKVAQGQRETLRFNTIPLEGARLRARLDLACSPDACNQLVLDDSAKVILAGARPLRVTVVGKKNVFLESALAVQPGIVLASADRAETVSSADTDLLIVNDAPGRIQDGVTALLIRPNPGNGRLEPMSPQRTPEFASAVEADPLASNLRMGEVNVDTAVFLRSELADKTVFLSKRGMPLVVRRDRSDARTVAVAFGLDATDLGLRYAWPVLLSNVLAWAGGVDTDFAAAESGVSPQDWDLAGRAQPALFKAEGAAPGPAHPLLSRLGTLAGFLLGCTAGLVILTEWALAQRRPDLGI